MGQLKFHLIYFRVKTGRQLQRNGSMWVGVLKERDKFRIRTGLVWIEFWGAGTGFGSERSWFGSDFGSARVSARDGFQAVMSFRAGRVASRDRFCTRQVSVRFFCFVWVGYFPFRLGIFVSF
ncbi:hypothetical protein HanRHA438_Chr08g0366041 [Helianthus annuus]|nr:hypothetical protein HanRHA438_Chr08g0366041 [Helianthus annuus]